MVGKNHTAQDLTIKLLQIFSPTERFAVSKQAKSILAGNTDAITQLNLCVMMASELDYDPKKYKRDFVFLAKTIFARQNNKSVEKVTQKEIGKRLNYKDSSINNFIRSIQDHVRKLTPEEIKLLCGQFDQASDRLFWENQIYILFNELPVPDVTDGPVLTCLQAVWDCLMPEEQRYAIRNYPSQNIWFDKLSKADEIPQSTGLYEFVDSELKKAHISQDEICYQWNMEPDTYRAYRKAWTEFEENGFSGRYPKNRLSRERLLYLAVILDLDFYTTAGMLAMADYDFFCGEPDTTVATYLLEHEHPKEYVLSKLHPWVK